MFAFYRPLALTAYCLRISRLAQQCVLPSRPMPKPCYVLSLPLNLFWQRYVVPPFSQVILASSRFGTSHFLR